MGIATALVVIGGSHQNDTGIGPQVIAELWEGDRANWSVRSIGSKDIEFRVDPNSPDDIFDELVNALRKVCGIAPNEPLETSIAVTIFGQSTTISWGCKSFRSVNACSNASCNTSIWRLKLWHR